MKSDLRQGLEKKRGFKFQIINDISNNENGHL